MEKQYEFDENQNSVVEGLSYKMRGVGIFLIVVSLFMVVAAALAIYFSASKAAYADALIGLVGMLVGFWMLRASRFFKAIVDTQGNDITNLIDALWELRKFFTIVYWVLAIGLLLVLVKVGFILFWEVSNLA